ncbi:radical SAM protein [Pelomonas sp. Root1237]|uniref:radical SAM protein n=1 Tax=Pelomonas sp. Root1237 TaxID=1736434 RepID=UPI0009EB0817
MRRTALISVSERCLIGCTFCFRADTGRADMSVATYCRALTRLRDIGVTAICLTGGEPTHHPRFAQFVRISHQYGISVSIITAAGNAIGEKRLSRMSRLLERVTVSVDSSAVQRIGRTSRTLESGKRLLEACSEANSRAISFSFYDLNGNEVDDVYRSVKASQCSIEFSPLVFSEIQRNRSFPRYSTDVLREDIKKLEARFLLPVEFYQGLESRLSPPSQGRCCGNQIYISPSGEIRLCPYGKSLASVFDDPATVKENTKNGYCSADVRCSFYCAAKNRSSDRHNAPSRGIRWSEGAPPQPTQRTAIFIASD